MKEGDELWTRYAAAYDAVVTQTPEYRKLLVKILHELRGLGRVSDIGCGTGELINALAKDEDNELVGVDSNPAMLARARAKVQREGVEFHLLDANSADFEAQFPYENYFDGAACINTLYHLKDAELALGRMYGITKKGGILILSGPKPDHDLGYMFAETQAWVEAQPNRDELMESLETLVKCNQKLATSGMPNLYFARDLSKLLLEKIGFSRILLADDNTYFGQGHFVVAEK